MELYKNEIHTRTTKTARIFLYNASLENEKEQKQLQQLLEQAMQYNDNIIKRSIVLNGIYEGIFATTNNGSVQQEQLMLLEGEKMRFRGVAICKHKNCNTWYCRPTKDGKQIYISAKTQQDCYDKLKAFLKKPIRKTIQQNLITQKPKKQPTLLDWFNKWLTLYKQDVKQGTRKDYNARIKHLGKLLKMPIDTIKAIDILEQLNTLPNGRTKQKVYELAKVVFCKAVDNDLIVKNPMQAMDKPKHTRVNGKALSNKDEIDIEQIFINKNADMFLVCLYQGLRKGEMLALTIQDVDFENKTITINKSLNYKNEIDTTKNIYSVRTMPLFDKTARLLEKYKGTSGRIFTPTYTRCEKIFNRLVKGIDTKYTIHSLRHTFITRCQECNVPLHIIQKWVGHTIGSSITNSVYTHSRELAELENIDKINKILT